MGKGQDGECGASLRLIVGGKRDMEQILAGMRSLELPGSFLVGGCVRDMLLGKEPKDWDMLACGVGADELIPHLQTRGQADPLVVADQLVGARFYADWTPPEGIEIALPRVETSTGPSHQDFRIEPMPLPEGVSRLPLPEREIDWVPILQTDAQRRDFTCNTLLHDIESGDILDPTGHGIADVENRVLRTVTPDSFRDDPLRTLRGLARVSHDGMSFEAETQRQAREWAHAANHTTGDISAERVQMELDKILRGSNSTKAFELLRDWQAIDGVLPGWGECVGFNQQSRYHDLSVDQHIFRTLEHADQMNYSPQIKMAMLLHDIGKPPTAKPGKDGHLHYHQAKSNDSLWQSDPQRARAHEEVGAEMATKILRGLRYPEEDVHEISYLVRHHMFSEERDFADRPRAKQENIARRMLYKHGLERSEKLLEVRACDLHGKGETPKLGWNLDIESLLNRIEEQKTQPYRLEHLNINGKQIIDMGVKPGPQVGEVLQKILKQVVGDPSMNEPEKLQRLARSLI